MAAPVPLRIVEIIVHTYPAPAPEDEDKDDAVADVEDEDSISITLNPDKTAIKEIVSCPIGTIFQVGLLSCAENIKVTNSSMRPWSNQIKKLNIVGPVFSPYNLWELLGQFKNLETLDWKIVSCDRGSGVSMAEIDERSLVANHCIQEIKIHADFNSFKESTAEEKEFILAMIKYSLKMALRCSQFEKFNFDLPMGDKEEVYFLLRNFLNHTRYSETYIERNVGQRRLTCDHPELPNVRQTI